MGDFWGCLSAKTFFGAEESVKSIRNSGELSSEDYFPHETQSNRKQQNMTAEQRTGL